MSISSAAVRQCDKAKILFKIAILGQNLAPKAPKILCHRLVAIYEDRGSRKTTGLR
jgi:hypothetical protein